jgi:hypothetical protein
MMQIRTRVQVQEVGDFDGSPGAIFLCDGKRLTVTGLTQAEARGLAKHLYGDLYITIADFHSSPLQHAPEQKP